MRPVLCTEVAAGLAEAAIVLVLLGTGSAALAEEVAGAPAEQTATASAAPPAGASAVGAPAKFIFATQDVLKPGTFDEYQRLQAQKAKVLKAAHWPRVSLGLTNLTGPIKTRVLHFSFYASFEDFGSDNVQIGKQAELHRALRNIEKKEEAILVSREVEALVYHPDLSYRGEFNWADMRYMSMIINVLRPGTNIPYQEKSAIVKKAHIEAQIAENLPIYTNYSGGRLASYFLLRPVASHRAFDEMGTQLQSDRYKVSTLTRENQLKVHELFARSVELEEDYYFALVPELSYTTPEWAAGNLDFWKP